ncbi:MAG: HAMP domain-containing histidine kinase [Sphingomonadales bacterium]|nr:HAMP domain-containing histidine kinase [Sphingomonadales bacterium]
MRYDDRLATVLRIGGSSQAVARNQFQQLIDLLGTSPADARGELLDQAHVRLAELAGELPAAMRAAALATPGLRLRSPRLVAALIAAEPMVAAAAVRAAELTEAQWLDLIPALPAGARGVLRVRRDYPDAVRALMARLGIGDAALAGAAEAARAAPDAADPAVPVAPVVPFPVRPATAPAAESASGIGAIVRRIEAFRRARDAHGGATDLPQLPLGDAPPASAPHIAAVDFTTDAAGRIDWADRRVAAALAGTDLGRFEHLRQPLRQRQPIRGLTVTLDGGAAIAGEWRVDAGPRFEAQTGRFSGYAGRLRRIVTDGDDVPAASRAGADALRQVLHELRTPVNAIQGFAEIIQQQLYGPTPHEYRALSAVIVADAARMLAGFEELERLAKLGSGAERLAEGTCDFAEVVRAALARLAPQAETRGFTLHCEDQGRALPVAMAPIDAERLVWRLLAAVAGAARAGDALRLALGELDGRVALLVSMPEGLARLPDEALFRGGAGAAGVAGLTGMFGTGFALRLARVEARAAGGVLSRHEEMLNLSLPHLTRIAAPHSDGDGGGAARKDAPAA